MKIVADLPDELALELAQQHDSDDLDAALADAAQLYCELLNADEMVDGDAA